MSTLPTPSTALPTKQWSVSIVMSASGSLKVLRDGVHLDLNQIGPGQVTPVELLLVSIGTCFALSSLSAFPLRQQPVTALEIKVTGTKAAQLPSRLAEVRLEIRFGESVPAAEAHRIATLAKQMCTVTNTIAAVPPGTFEVVVT